MFLCECVFRMHIHYASVATSRHTIYTREWNFYRALWIYKYSLFVCCPLHLLDHLIWQIFERVYLSNLHVHILYLCIYRNVFVYVVSSPSGENHPVMLCQNLCMSFYAYWCCVFVWFYLHMYIHTCTHVCAHVYVCPCGNYVCLYVFIYSWCNGVTYACMYEYMFMYTYTHIIFMYSYFYTHIYIYIHIYTHVYVCMICRSWRFRFPLFMCMHLWWMSVGWF
jgi:hypothetical protein